jgi:glycosyltransferase involved in cell wall biosynthesis
MHVAVLNHFANVGSDPVVVASLSRNPIRYWWMLRSVNVPVVHYHHARWSTLFATAVALRHRKGASLITLHGHELDRHLAGNYHFVGWLARWSIKRFDVLIAVSEEVAGSMRRALPDREVLVIPAYLPPEAEADRNGYAPETRGFVENGEPTLLVAAYSLAANGTGRTLYGLEFALEVFSDLADDHSNLRLAIFLAQAPRNATEHRRLQSITALASARHFHHRVRITIGEPLVPAFGGETIYLRPTTTDGDAVAIREALSAGVPVIASDVVSRPSEVAALPLTVDAWHTAIAELISSGPVDHPPRHDSHVGALIALYRRLLSPLPDDLAENGSWTGGERDRR